MFQPTFVPWAVSLSIIKAVVVFANIVCFEDVNNHKKQDKVLNNLYGHCDYVCISFSEVVFS